MTLKELIEEKGFTMHSFALKSNIAYTTITTINKRKIDDTSIKSCYEIARALGITTDELYNILKKITYPN